MTLIDVGGSPSNQGETHGREARDAVHHNIAVYARRFRDEAKLSAPEVRMRCELVWARIRSEAPAYAEGVQGIANGAGAELWDVVSINVRYEILYARLSELLMAGETSAASECTAFAVDSAGGLVMGQNWDWIPEVQGVVLRIQAAGDGGAQGGAADPTEASGAARPANALPDVLCYSEAGIFGGKIGLNSAGVGLAVNGLASTDDDWRLDGTPFHVRTWRALRSQNLDGAVKALSEGSHACSANFVAGSATEGAFAVETAPSDTCLWPLEEGRLVHTNHFLVPDKLALKEPPNPRRRFSLARRARLDALLAGGETAVEVLQGHLRDHEGHPNSVCRHPNPDEPSRQYQTVASAILDLAGGRMWVTDGPPCSAEYQEFGLAVYD